MLGPQIESVQLVFAMEISLYKQVARSMVGLVDDDEDEDDDGDDHGDDDDAGGDADDGDVSYVEDDGAHADVDAEDDVTLWFTSSALVSVLPESGRTETQRRVLHLPCGPRCGARGKFLSMFQLEAASRQPSKLFRAPARPPQ